MALGNVRWKLQTEGSALSGLGLPPIVAPIVLCVGGVPKQSKMVIETEIENNFVYYLNSKCCRVAVFPWTVICSVYGRVC